MISIFRAAEDDPRTMDYVPQQNNDECVKELTKEQKNFKENRVKQDYGAVITRKKLNVIKQFFYVSFFVVKIIPHTPYK